MVGARKGYETVYWGKMPINFRPQAFRREEVERAVAYATRSFPDVLDLVPDFSVLTVGTGQVQVSVSWDTDSDVDLHVVDPNNQDVYYEQPAVDSGGVIAAPAAAARNRLQ